ncbi:MAG: argininosuccinate lyase, partial [Acidimicrobiia bacterium]
MALSVSLPFDQRMAPEDIEGSRAHVTMLVETGLLTEVEGTAVLGALDSVAG